MSAIWAGAPLPSSRRIDELDDPFWAGCARGEFLVHRCGACGRGYWPASTCVVHGSGQMEWVAASGLGTIHTFAHVHRTPDPAFRDLVPYVGVVVLLDEGPYFHSSLIGRDPTAVRIGSRVSVVFDRLSECESIPRFRLLDDASGSYRKESQTHER